MNSTRRYWKAAAFIGALVLSASWIDAGVGAGHSPAMADFETLNFRGAAACAPCHSENGAAAGSGPGVNGLPAMVGEWSGSMMSQSSLDPFWRAKVRSEVLRAPHVQTVIEGKCATCHAPMAATEAKLAGDPVLLFDDGFFDPDHELHAAAVEGVSCSLCHRIENSETLGTPDGFSGGYVVEGVTAPVARPLYGPWSDTFDQPMAASVGLRNLAGEQVGDPAVCATCHNLETPFLDASGTIVGTDFPEQMPFSEWLESDLAAALQPEGCGSCHMPLGDAGRIAGRPLWIPVRQRAEHTFTSANTQTLSVLAVEAALAGDDPTPLLAAIEAARVFLRRAGSLEVLGASLGAEGLELQLAVGNATGHKLPTAFPSRRVFLHAVVTDEAGDVVFESGAVMASGRIVGVDSDADPSAFEPHYDIITSPDEVQVYESILGTTDDDVTYTLLRAGQYLKDNRLVPAGFVPLAVPDNVRPVGGCLSDQDFGPGRDEISYRISGLAGERYRVRVELRHQAIGYPFVQDLRELAGDPVIDRFLALFDHVQPGTEVIDEVALEVSRS